MTNDGQISRPPSARRLARITAVAFVVATILAVCVVLPAEFSLDPTGFGQLSGLSRLSGPKEVIATAPAGPTENTQYFPAAFRSDVIDIPLAASGNEDRNDELEYKVRMKAGEVVVYSWTVEGLTDPEEFYYDFHSESTPAPGQVVEYRQMMGADSNGALTAPFEGVHGWYFQNQSVKPVTVHLKLSGFYQLVPPGEYGNLSGIEPGKK